MVHGSFSLEHFPHECTGASRTDNQNSSNTSAVAAPGPERLAQKKNPYPHKPKQIF
jgi:hypothetical protein